MQRLADGGSENFPSDKRYVCSNAQRLSARTTGIAVTDDDGWRCVPSPPDVRVPCLDEISSATMQQPVQGSDARPAALVQLSA
jgi:hypothetical protein